MALFELNSKIKIGGFKPFKGVTEVTVKKSLRNYCDTAIIKVPATAVLKPKGDIEPTKSILTAQQFKRGDKVTIELGYNGKLRVEFEGFVARVNKATPCELECEGYAFQLREKTFSKSYKSTTLKELLKDLIKDTDIVLGDIDDINYVNYTFDRQNGFNVLQLIQQDSKKTVNIWFDGNIIHAGLLFGKFSEKNKSGKADAKLVIGQNIVRDGQMKQRVAGDTRVEVEFYNIKEDGTKTTAKVGIKNSNQERKKMQAIADAAILKKLATEAEAQKNYTGAEGVLDGFIQPYYKPGAKIEILDPKYPENDGSYFVESTEVRYNTSGAKRQGKISFKA
jgi:hypothetical protein